ncbi:MAG: class I SAM-dependent methyltransferase [Clostridia bacterium]|nr:class I SAM-dependent methyltransferase [Clostridia bacterium]
MKQANVSIGTHGEQYGNWMSNPVFYMFGAGIALAAALTILSFFVFHLPVLGIVFGVILVALAAITCWFAWIRKQYSFTGGGMMAKVHQVLLSHLDFDGKGTLLEVGCGSGALTIRSLLTWPESRAVGIDYWGAVYNYSKALCEKNAASEGVGSRCTFQRGDANHLDFPDETFDAVVSNYVYHNITNAPDKHALLKESLRVLKKGGVFALQDDMKPRMYGDMKAFMQELRDAGFSDVRLVDTAEEIFGSKAKAKLVVLGNSKALVGRK